MVRSRKAALTVALALTVATLAAPGRAMSEEIGLEPAGEDAPIELTSEPGAEGDGTAEGIEVAGEPEGGEDAQAAEGQERGGWVSSITSLLPTRNPMKVDLTEQPQTVTVSYVDRDWDDRTRKPIEGDASAEAIPYTGQSELNDGTYAVTKDVTVDDCLAVRGKVRLILCNGATLTAKDGIFVSRGATLKIYGQRGDKGKIVAEPKSGPGIGAVSGTPGGHLEICGGTIVAHGGKNGAGIGGANKGALMAFVGIYGGNVDARGGQDGAGIGGGADGDGGDVHICGGKVKAVGSRYAAGIGGGNDDGTGGTIYIKGGEVDAQGGDDAAGIGGAEAGSAGDIHITGGTVTARGGNNAAGIGCGEFVDCGDGGFIYITGGKVRATGGQRGAGIGGGKNSHCTAVNITGGDVRAVGTGGAGIGGGSEASSELVAISGGKVEAIAGCYEWYECGAAIGGGSGEDGGYIVISGGEVIAESDIGAGIGGGKARNGDCVEGDTMLEPAENSGSGGEINISGGKVSAKSQWGFGIGAGGSGREARNIGSAGKISIYGCAEVNARGGYAGIGGDSGTINIEGGTTRASDIGSSPDGKRSGGILLESKKDARLNLRGGTLIATSEPGEDGAITLQRANEKSVSIADGIDVIAGKDEASARVVLAPYKRAQNAIDRENHYVKVAPH